MWRKFCHCLFLICLSVGASCVSLLWHLLSIFTYIFTDHPVVEKPSAYRYWINTICGIPESSDKDDFGNRQHRAKTVEEIRWFLTESNRDKYILNTAAGFTTIVVFFLFGFYV